MTFINSRVFVCATAALLAVTASACGSPPDEAVATNGTLVHDIPSDHPRIRYFDQFSETVATSTDGRLAIEINPDGEVLAGRASLDAVRSGAADLALVNMTHLEAMDPAAGFMNLPFAFNDTMMADGRNRTAVFDVQSEVVRPHGVELLGYMRGADQLIAFPQDDVAQVGDIEGRRIRVAAAGSTNNS